MKISVTIITLNEEAKIADALRSVYWADEVLVVDSHSTDNTREIAAELGARVVERDWAGFSEQKQFATDEASNDIVFSLDADERVSAELAAEIKQIKESDELAFDGYTVPRLSIYMGREIRHGSWYPDRQLRLFDRRKAAWKQVVIHESVEMRAGATIGQLKGDLIHKSVDSVKHHAAMLVERYAPLGAQAMHERGKRTSALQIAAAGPTAFTKDYILKAGFLDGVPGLTIAAFSAYHAALKHMMLYELQNGKPRHGSRGGK
ncbi:MAG: glycosyltransferase family 2 protein [Pyrinomonadaceae bacterium]|nr:glycosyltransferase family 2 protein [Pyrinomonadaceae bacterium]MBP6212469.1 glycosyltransferase family 2 protein [Pyrinomonadaceae bacterium]